MRAKLHSDRSSASFSSFVCYPLFLWFFVRFHKLELGPQRVFCTSVLLGSSVRAYNKPLYNHLVYSEKTRSSLVRLLFSSQTAPLDRFSTLTSENL